MKLKGINASSGIGMGRAYCLIPQNTETASVFQGAEREIQRLREAGERFIERTSAMAEKLRQRLGGSESEILLGQITMLGDPYMQEQMENLITGGSTAENAVTEVCTMFAEMFDGLDDDMMRQRATDVRDMMARLKDILAGREQPDLSALPEGTVLVAHDLTPSMTVGLSPERVCAVVTEVGGVTSHSAILARALGIPAVLSVPDALRQIAQGAELIVDGEAGEIIIEPDAAEREAALTALEALARRKELLRLYQGRPTCDADGNHYDLYANIGTPRDAEGAAAADAEGIGLFRTEFLFMDRSSLPDEEEQLAAYLAASEAMGGRELIIRTLDVGGDKAIDYLGMEKEDNPFLGHRAIRYCLDNPEMFRTQLRALLRAGAEKHNIRIMLPLVTCLEELRAARKLLEECKAELKAEGLDYDAEIKLGIMVETPAAALMADVLARESDFFSIGTNDLTGYTMAADRGNAGVAKLYTAYQPAVLRSIRGIIAAGRAAGIPVGMCGEAAADPLLTPLLISFGLTEFSVSASAVLATRAAIAAWSKSDADAAAGKAMEYTDAAGVKACLRSLARG